jgi:hypothetical protein
MGTRGRKGIIIKRKKNLSPGGFLKRAVLGKAAVERLFKKFIFWERSLIFWFLCSQYRADFSITEA